jgi:hypothetical protein
MRCPGRGSASRRSPPAARPSGWAGTATRRCRALRFGDGWHGAGDAAAIAQIRRRIVSRAEGTGRDPASLALAAVAFLVPPGFRQLGEMPGPALGGVRPTAARVREELGLLEEAGASSCSLWLPIAAEALPDALAWIAAEVM